MLITGCYNVQSLAFSTTPSWTRITNDKNEVIQTKILVDNPFRPLLGVGCLIVCSRKSSFPQILFSNSHLQLLSLSSFRPGTDVPIQRWKQVFSYLQYRKCPFCYSKVSFLPFEVGDKSIWWKRLLKLYYKKSLITKILILEQVTVCISWNQYYTAICTCLNGSVKVKSSGQHCFPHIHLCSWHLPRSCSRKISRHAKHSRITKHPSICDTTKKRGSNFLL